jgi:uncharacterized membrane protein
MSLFMFSLLAGLTLHQIVSIIQPTADGSEYRLGRRVVVKFEEGTYVIVKAAALALAVVLFVLLVTLIVTRGVHPSEGYAYSFADALTSPRMAAAVFGGLVGFLIGNLLNRILKNKDYQFKSSDHFEILLILVLVILGAGGEQWLRFYAQRVNKISVGATTEIAFSENQPKASRAATEQPNSARRTTTDESGGSAGLGKLGDLKDNILGNQNYGYRKDMDFIEILALYEGAPDPGPVEDQILVTKVLSPIGTCLSGIFQLNGDTTFIQQRLIPLGALLQDIITPGGKDFAEINRELKRQVDEIARYAKRETGLAEIGKKAPEYSCNDILTTAKDGGLFDNDDALNQFYSSARLPYAAMAYASVMAALHNYEAASIAMFRWIENHSDPGKADKKDVVKARWNLLRARFAQGAFIEEWIRARGPAASSSLRQYHIDNLMAIRDDMKSFTVIREMSAKNSDYELKPGPFGATHSDEESRCEYPEIRQPGKTPRLPNDDQRKVLDKLYESYLSAKNDYIDQALKHPIVKVVSATTIAEESGDLMKHNLRCVYKGRRDVIRAQHIERYVRSEINLMENVKPLKSADDLRDRVLDIRQKLTFGFQLVRDNAEQARRDQKAAPTLQDRLQPKRIVEVHETLLATDDQLQGFYDRLGTP